MVIGFIGLGIMGKPMARNLIKGGHQLVVFDTVHENIAALEKDGARAAASSSEVARQCNFIITMLPNSPHVRQAVLGPQGVLEGAHPGTILVDMSSIAPAASQEICQACQKAGVRMLDAPVSGGEPKAIDGTLSIMVGGDRQLFEQCVPLLRLMGASAVWCGEIGAGNTTKLANQVIVAVNIAACAEAFLLASRAGVDPQLVLEAIRGGLAGSTVMNAKVPMMLAHQFKPGFRIDLHIKDLNNALETGHQFGSPLPLCAQVMEMMQTLRTDGDGILDHSAIAKWYEKVCGCPMQAGSEGSTK